MIFFLKDKSPYHLKFLYTSIKLYKIMQKPCKENTSISSEILVPKSSLVHCTPGTFDGAPPKMNVKTQNITISRKRLKGNSSRAHISRWWLVYHEIVFTTILTYWRLFTRPALIYLCGILYVYSKKKLKLQKFPFKIHNIIFTLSDLKKNHKFNRFIVFYITFILKFINFQFYSFKKKN